MLLFQVMESRYFLLSLIIHPIVKLIKGHSKLISETQYYYFFRQSVSDRFYQALYSKLLDPSLKASSKQVSCDWLNSNLPSRLIYVANKLQKIGFLKELQRCQPLET